MNVKKEGKYCVICTPNGPICPSNWLDKSDWVENKEETEEEEEEEVQPVESDWDTDLDEAPVYCARVPTPMTWPRQPPKVLLFESRKSPAGWPAGVRPDLLPKARFLKEQKCTARRREV